MYGNQIFNNQEIYKKHILQYKYFQKSTTHNHKTGEEGIMRWH